ncbi:MAG TPA: DUF4239 domain-containing protein [Burkholderiales bacterium]|nr:DUF4239 domain-containing protein [Burkholderiales bacterium]
MIDSAIVFVFLPLLFAFILLFVWMGRWVGGQRSREETERERVGLVTVETAIYALLGLMVAFTFSGATSRFDARRAQTVQEANAIGTAYLRLDLLPAAAQPALRAKFREYVDARVAIYRALPDIGASNAHAARANALQEAIWTGSIAALRGAPPEASLLLVPALNDMIDITTTRAIALRTHTPTIILIALVVLTLICSLLIGYGLAGGKPFATNFHMIGFALMMTVTIYVIIDLDHPRVGLIRLDYVDQAMADVRAGMK